MRVRKVLGPLVRLLSSHPLALEATGARVTVQLGGRVIADTRDAITLREASHPPVHYIPLADVDAGVLRPSDHSTYCPFKGSASYFALQDGADVVPAAAWCYPAPREAVAAIKDHVAFHPHSVDVIEVHRAS